MAAIDIVNYEMNTESNQSLKYQRFTLSGFYDIGISLLSNPWMLESFDIKYYNIFDRNNPLNY